MPSGRTIAIRPVPGFKNWMHRSTNKTSRELRVEAKGLNAKADYMDTIREQRNEIAKLKKAQDKKK